MTTEDLPEKKATVELPGVKVEVTKDDSWETVSMIVVAVLVIYAGIKVINKFFDNKNNSLWK